MLESKLSICRLGWLSRLLFLLLVLLPRGSATAQPGPFVGMGAAAGDQPLIGIESPLISDEYILMPGDRVLVTVSGPVTYSYRSWITYEGRAAISLPAVMSQFLTPGDEIVDAVQVSGLTMREAADTVAAALRRHLRQADVKLTLVHLRSGVVFITGEVEEPGAYQVSVVARVSHVIAEAGGLAPLGSRSRIRIIRDGVVHSLADIRKFEADGDLSANPFVASGDIVHVPPVEEFVTVKGAVFGRGEYRLQKSSALTTEKERISEGIYELEPGDRVLNMIRKAGGITPWANLRDCYIDRIVLGGEGLRKMLPVDLHAVMFLGDSSRDLTLMNADILVVPPVNTLVYVQGEVNEPGPYLFTPNLRVSDYVGQAGGPTDFAHRRGIHIVRNNRRVSFRDDPVVEAGDRVIVPRVSIRWWQDYVTIIGTVVVPTASLLLSLYVLTR